MPLYEYQCQACGRRLERIQKFSDPPLETCPHCGGRLEKLISSPAIQFKGSGWYITDYARKGTTSTDSGSSSAKDSGDKSSSTDKTETPASKPAADAAPAAKDAGSSSTGSSATPKKD